MSEELKKYYKGKAKNPKLFKYDDDGNLIQLDKNGATIQTISLPIYRHPTFEEFDEMEKKRIEEITPLVKAYEDARKELRQKYSNPDSSDSDILRINRKVMEADIKLQGVRFPLRYVNSEEGIEIRKLDFEQPNEKRKIPYPIKILETRPFKLQEQYVRIGVAPSKVPKSVAEIKEAIQNSVKVILFAEPNTNDYGFLTLDWAVELEFNLTSYNSAKQAIYAELAKSFNDQEALQKIMIASSPMEINYTLEDVPGDKDINESKWNEKMKQLLYDVNLAKFNQFPELAGKLLETKNATLGAYLPNDNLIGIGISLDNVQSQNPNNWTGQNLLGKALMEIRDKIRIERQIAPQQSAIITQSDIAKETQEKPRVLRRARPKVAVPLEAIVPK